MTINGTTYEFVANAGTKPSTKGAVAVQVGVDFENSVANLSKALENQGIKAEITGTNEVTFSAVTQGSGLKLQIGDTADSFNQLSVAVGDMHTTALGLSTLDISTQTGALNAIKSSRTLSTRSPPPVVIWALSRTVWSIPATTLAS